jgi:hypothetical protein
LTLMYWFERRHHYFVGEMNNKITVTMSVVITLLVPVPQM